MNHLGNDLDLPFEGSPKTPLFDRGQAQMSGGMVVMAATADVQVEPPVAGIGGKRVTKPALVFRFATPDGRFYQPIMLVLDDDQMANAPKLVTDAVDAARKAAQA
jgi:hypothetical protein